MVTSSNRAVPAKSTSSATRRSHRKSRHGCLQCKARHMKCDELRPVCVNCFTTDRQCSFRDQPQPPHVRLPTSTESTPSPAAPIPATPASLNSAAASPASLGAIIQAAVSGAASHGSHASQTETLSFDGYDLSHLGLLHHFETQMLKYDDMPVFSTPGADQKAAVDALMKSAVSEPYLMDELLACSALHLSTIMSDAAEKQRCLHQAAQLQTRALTQFNTACPSVSDENCITMFLFSGLLGLHTLFDTTSFQHDFTQFLEKVIQFISLHRGIRSITSQSWHIIGQTEVRHIVNPMTTIDAMDPRLVESAPSECDYLLTLLTDSSDSLSSMALNACRDAVRWLQWVIKQRRNLTKSLLPHVAMAWPTCISHDFLQMLRQRRPEALVVLAHWAVFLHQDRDFWVFGDSGRILIESTRKSLGSYWDDWLTWPIAVLEAA